VKGFAALTGSYYTKPRPLFGLVLSKPVAFLNLALELLLPSIDYVEVVVSEPAPFLLGSALELFFLRRRQTAC
jgi:hypothetical protein